MLKKQKCNTWQLFKQIKNNITVKSYKLYTIYFGIYPFYMKNFR